MVGGWDCHVHVFEPGAAWRAGHYAPVPAPLPAIEACARAQGLDHLVLVQPSVYGHDHQVMLRALRAGQGRHRGVAVLPPDVADDELDMLHEAGVRGVRFNLVSPAGHVGDPEVELAALAPRLRARGWHVQWYVPAERLAEVARWQVDSGLVFVLDHLAGLHADLAPGAPAWAAAQALAARGAWIKLSGWYRLGGAVAPYEALQPAIRHVAALFGQRLVWGSDWPHTSFAPGRAPAYASTLDPVRAALGDAAVSSILGEQARALYS